MTPEEKKRLMSLEKADFQAKVKARRRYDLSEITTEYDTPAARCLLTMLEQAQEAAEAVDKERGNFVAFEPQIPGESKGTDYAESISELALRLRREIAAPPTGRGE